MRPIPVGGDIMNKFTALASAVVCMIAAPTHASAQLIADAVNDTLTPSAATWGANSVGWYYTPTTSYVLTGIGTKFGSADGRTVTERIYAGTIGNLTLLSSGTFTASTTFSTPIFTPISLVAGTQYFVAFDNLKDLGVSITSAAGASNRLGGLYSGFGPTGSPSYNNGPFTNSGQAIMQFYTTNASTGVPEADTWAMLMLGFGGLGIAARRGAKRVQRVRFV